MEEKIFEFGQYYPWEDGKRLTEKFEKEEQEKELGQEEGKKQQKK